ncbi:arylesterase [Halothiobacillus diazotrophicus]|uniref:Arylesterase n=2 Tax=Halothiobacillus diazotrophicus TaxID=1860122 RepID=A0A191ZHM2_9GAMM|nr:arylesterase [Halothiobacillus diazotrophicus]
MCVFRWLIVLFLACSSSLAWGQAPLAPEVRAHTVLVLGDSLSAAYNLPEDKGWVALMTARMKAAEQSSGARIPWDVINASISGETTSGGLSRLPELLAVHQPGWVLIELGANDGLRGLPLSIVRQNLQKLIALSEQAGARVVLLGIMLPPNYGPLYTTPFRDMYHALAAQNHLPLVPFILQGVAENRSLMQADGLHPTAAGEPQVLANIWSVVGPLWGFDGQH